MGSLSTISFVRKPARQGLRSYFAIPPEVARFLNFEQHYEVALRPIGSLVWRAG